jgi:hypothetical protein
MDDLLDEARRMPDASSAPPMTCQRSARTALCAASSGRSSAARPRGSPSCAARSTSGSQTTGARDDFVNVGYAVSEMALLVDVAAPSAVPRDATGGPFLRGDGRRDRRLFPHGRSSARAGAGRRSAARSPPEHRVLLACRDRRRVARSRLKRTPIGHSAPSDGTTPRCGRRAGRGIFRERLPARRAGVLVRAPPRCGRIPPSRVSATSHR